MLNLKAVPIQGHDMFCGGSLMQVMVCHFSYLSRHKTMAHKFIRKYPYYQDQVRYDNMTNYYYYQRTLMFFVTYMLVCCVSLDD